MNGVWVFLGGGCGACLRYLISLLVNHWHVLSFPFFLFLVNGLGSFLFGFLSGFSSSKSAECFFLIGFLGALTTFSAYAHEMFALWKSQKYSIFLFHVIFNHILCLGTIWAGQLCSKFFTS